MTRPPTNRRRQTLGAVNGAGNRRNSMDPSQMKGGATPSTAGKARPPRGRASMIPRVGRENNHIPPPTPSSVASSSTKNRRRSSIGGGGGDRRQSLVPPSAPAKVDPRPITEKAFQQDCIKQLLHYLNSSGYEYPISHKSLARPSGKDFTNIVTFMLRRWDPDFGDGTLKMEDEVAMNFKALGYPFPVSKTALVAAGSPHTWPSLLAALTWLMERLQRMETIEQDLNEPGNYESVEEMEQKTDKAFFKYLGGSYDAFLRNDEKMAAQLEGELADRFEYDDGFISKEIEQMTDENALIVERINQLTMSEQDLQEYVQKREDYSTDLEQFHDLIRQMEEHVETLTKKKTERQRELAETNRTLERVNKHVAELKETVTNQELSLEDVTKLENERKSLDEAIDKAMQLKDEKRKALWDDEAQMESNWNDLEAAASDYNSNLSELGLLPLVSEKGVNMKVVLNKSEDVGDQTALVGVDLVGKVQPTLDECKQQYSDQFAGAKWKYQEALDQLEKSEEAMSMAMEKLKIVKQKLEKSEETLQAENEAQDAKLAVRVREAESMEAKVASIRDPVAIEEQMARYERQLAELEALRMKYNAENVAKKKAVCDEIEQARKNMESYEEFCKEKVAEVQQYRNKKKDAYGKLNIPDQFAA